MTEKKLLNTRTHIAGVLKSRREELGLSQLDVAERAGLGLATIQRVEYAKFFPNMKQYLLHCEALEMEPSKPITFTL